MKVGQRKGVNSPLAAWLNANGMTMREFGRRIGIAHSKLSGIIDGQAMPGLIVAYEVERLTQGEVPMESWLGGTFAQTNMAELRSHQPPEFQSEGFKTGSPGEEESDETEDQEGSEEAFPDE